MSQRKFNSNTHTGTGTDALNGKLEFFVSTRVMFRVPLVCQEEFTPGRGDIKSVCSAFARAKFIRLAAK